jgi:hypothetical protein
MIVDNQNFLDSFFIGKVHRDILITSNVFSISFNSYEVRSIFDTTILSKSSYFHFNKMFSERNGYDLPENFSIKEIFKLTIENSNAPFLLSASPNNFFVKSFQENSVKNYKGKISFCNDDSYSVEGDFLELEGQIFKGTNKLSSSFYSFYIEGDRKQNGGFTSFSGEAPKGITLDWSQGRVNEYNTLEQENMPVWTGIITKYIGD